MRFLFKLHWALRRHMVEDLKRKHKFAHERVGFISTRAATLSDGIMILAESYEPVADENYVQDNRVGARINGDALRRAMQKSLSDNSGIFHVHLHEHDGRPRPSRTDLTEAYKYVPDFFNVNNEIPHGIIILSRDNAFGLCWLKKEDGPKVLNQFVFAGSPLQISNVDIQA